MKADTVTIRKLLENRHRFCVPTYQRHYVWTLHKQWEPFWNEIRIKAIERFNKRDRRFSHFMGAVVLEAGTPSSCEVTSFQVVDGQQRLTTFQLYLSAARDYAKQAGFQRSADLIEVYLFNASQHLMENAEVEKYKIWPTKYDRELFQDIVGAGQPSLKEKYREHFNKNKDKIKARSTVPNLLGGYGYFFERIKHTVESDELDDNSAKTIEANEGKIESLDASIENSDQNHDLMERRLNALWQALVEEFKVVEIILEEGDDAQVIFETLNERGEPLLAADLVRNNIFHRADAKKEHAENLFDRHWKEFEDPFWSIQEKQGRYKKARIEFFLSNFIAGKVVREIALSKLFSEYKAFVKIQTAKPQGGYPTVEVEIQDLLSYGKIYRRLLERNPSDPLGHFADRLHPWDVKTVYPLVLRIWAENDLKEEEREECLSTLLTLVVRRAICGLTTKNYNKFFLSVLRYLEVKGFSHDNLVAFLCAQTPDSGRLPTDREFEESWISLPMYGHALTPYRVRAVLESIERKKRQKFHETDKLNTDLSVEHILPIKWEEHWPLLDGTKPTGEEISLAMPSSEEDKPRIGQIVRRKRLINTFGNLTVLSQPLNSSVSNGPYEAKRKSLIDHSLLVLNREITKNEVWGEDQIESRGRELFEVAKTLWPYPVIEST